jgi:ribose/xylose/arabinose/galactoside ABC-type transport system permease subunit
MNMNIRRLNRQDVQVLLVLGFLLLLIIALYIGNPRFISVRNFINLCRQVAPVIIVGCAMSLVIISGNIDLSIGSTLGFSAVMLGYFCVWGLNLYLGLLLLVVIGIAVGLLNWFLIDKLVIPAIITTIATMTTSAADVYDLGPFGPRPGDQVRGCHSTIFEYTPSSPPHWSSAGGEDFVPRKRTS